MNLHEECLLKYLSNPSELSNSTEVLKFNNSLIEKGLFRVSKTTSNSKNIEFKVNRL